MNHHQQPPSSTPTVGPTRPERNEARREHPSLQSTPTVPPGIAVGRLVPRPAGQVTSSWGGCSRSHRSELTGTRLWIIGTGLSGACNTLKLFE